MYALKYVILISTVTFNLVCSSNTTSDDLILSNNSTWTLGKRLEDIFMDSIDGITRYLQKFNDKHIGGSELGKLFNYEDIKPVLEEKGRDGRSVKKMSTAMMPLIFHVGATSTWMLLTSLMAAKSVAIGLALLVFKIAVSSAKVASFFTALKAKQNTHHHEWSWSPPEYGHDRSMRYKGFVPNEDWQPYSAEWTPNEVAQPEYKTIPLYRNSDSNIPPYGSVASEKRDTKTSRK